MPVYDYRYKIWEGRRRGPVFRWLAIPKFYLADFFNHRLFISLFIFAWVQFLLRVVYIYLLVNPAFLKAMRIPAEVLPPVGAFFFKNMLDVQMFFTLAFAFLLGGGLVSKDLAHNALVLYVSKPINRWEYFLGKLSVIFGLSLLVSWVQAVLLFGLQLAVSEPNSLWRLYFWHDYAWILGAVTLYALLIGGTVSLLILAASCLTRNPRTAGAIFAIYLIGAMIVAGVLVGALQRNNCWAISPGHALVYLGEYIFRMADARTPVRQPVAWAAIAANVALCAVIIKARLDRAARHGH